MKCYFIEEDFLQLHNLYSNRRVKLTSRLIREAVRVAKCDDRVEVYTIYIVNKKR